MAIPADQVAGKSTAAAKKAAEDAEKDLFERAGLEPPDEDEGPTDGQRALAATHYHQLGGMDLMRLNVKLTKAATNQLMGFRKELAGFRTVQHMHSATMHEILDTLAHVKRQLATFEQHGILPGELAANPDLNPLLGNHVENAPVSNSSITLTFHISASYLPFTAQAQVLHFFDNWERTVALQKYVTRNCDFSQRGFVLAVIRLICSPEYRRQYSFPVGQMYEDLTYIPAR